eukprot:gene1339-32696_t
MPPAASSLKGRGTAAAKPALALRLPPGAAESLAEFPNSTNEKLSGLFVNVQGSQDVVILCHGYASSRNGFRLPEIAKELASKRLCSLRFDFSGNGASGGVFDFASYQREVADLRAAVLYVRGTLNKNVAAILAVFDDVPLTISVAGRFDTKRGALIERESTDMEEACKKITISEVMTIHGTDDTTIPVEDAHSIAKCVRNHTLHLVNGADHNFTDSAHSEMMIKKITEFIQAGL